MRRLALSLIVSLMPIAAACAHARANTTPDSPTLEVPAPPGHDVEPVEPEPVTSTPLPGDAEEPRRNPARPRPVAPREPAKAPEPAKPEPSRPEPQSEPPKLESKPDETRPALPLQTTPATAEGEAERTIRATMTRATTDLNRIDYRALSADGRSQYDQAKRLLRQADEAMREKNLVFARSVADKAATIATQLARR